MDTREHLEIPAALPDGIRRLGRPAPAAIECPTGQSQRHPAWRPGVLQGNQPSARVPCPATCPRSRGSGCSSTNDQFGDGRITRVHMSFFTDKWHHQILGWGRELNRVAIGYLNPQHGGPAAGKSRVRLSALGPGKHNLDVRIVERKLTEPRLLEGRSQDPDRRTLGRPRHRRAPRIPARPGLDRERRRWHARPVTLEKLGCTSSPDIRVDIRANTRRLLSARSPAPEGPAAPCDWPP